MPDSLKKSLPGLVEQPFRVELFQSADLISYRVAITRNDQYASWVSRLENRRELARVLDEAVVRFRHPWEEAAEIRQVLHARIEHALEFQSLGRDRPLLERMAQFTEEPVSWLWPGRIAANKLNLLAGNSGVGKSLLALDIISRFTTGRRWPDEHPDTPRRLPGDVLLVAETDDPSEMIRPRLNAMGADLERVTLLRNVLLENPVAADRQPFSLAGSGEMLSIALRKMEDCRLLVLDPFSIQLHKRPREAAALITELAALASEFELTILIVDTIRQLSLRPSSGISQALYRLKNSLATAWAVLEDPFQLERRFVLPVKNNLAKVSDGLAFEIQTGACSAPRLCWDREPLALVATNSQQALTAHHQLKSNRIPQRELACRWLATKLVAGARPSQELLAEARKEKISEKPLRQALHQLGGAAERGPEGRWLWSLPPKSGDLTSAETHKSIPPPASEASSAKGCHPPET